MKIITATVVLFIFYMVQKLLYRYYWYRGLDVDCRFDREYIECGEKACLIETIENDKVLPLPVFHVKFSIDKSLVFTEKENAVVTDYYHKNEVFSVLGHQRVTRRLEFTGTRRGVMSIQNLSVLVKDLFMTDQEGAMLPAPDSIYVYPAKLGTDRFRYFYRGIFGSTEIRKAYIEDPLIFRGVREYRPGDAYRSINWKQTARCQGSPMVNVYGYSMDSRVKILLNLDTDYMIETNKLLEEAISLASSFARDLTSAGVSVALITNALAADKSSIVPVDFGTGKPHMNVIDRSLTEIAGSEGKDAFMRFLEAELAAGRGESDTMYLVISPYHKDDMLGMLDRIESTGNVVRLVVPYYDEFPYHPDRPYAYGWEVMLGV